MIAAQHQQGPCGAPFYAHLSALVIGILDSTIEQTVTLGQRVTWVRYGDGHLALTIGLASNLLKNKAVAAPRWLRQ